MLVEENLTIAKVIAHNSAAAIAFNDPNSAKSILTALNPEPFIMASCIYGKDGKILASYTSNPSNALSFPAIVENGYKFTKDSLWIFYPVFFEGEKVGTVFLKTDLNELSSKIRNYILTIAVIIAFILSGIFFISSKIQKIIS